MSDERAPDRRPTRLGPEAIAHTNFPTAVRGFDRDKVKDFLQQVAGELRESRDREALLRTELQEAVERLAQRDHVDEAELTALLGEETARVLTAAREAAAEIRTKGEESVARLLREAQDEATRLRSEAETVHQRASAEAEEAAQRIRDEAEAQAAAVTTEAEARAAAVMAEVDGLVAGAKAEAEQITAEARAEADAIRAAATEQAAAEVEAGREEGRRMVADASAVRERVLADLTRKRKAARSQLEQLRAGRDRLLDAYGVVGRTLEEANAELERALPEAKLAAEAAARRVEEEPEATVEQLEAEVEAAREAGLPLVDTAAPASERDEEPEQMPEPEPAPEVDAAANNGAANEVVPPPPPEPEPFRLPKRHRRRRDPDLGEVEYTPLREIDPLEEVKIIAGEVEVVTAEVEVATDSDEEQVDVDAIFAKLRTEREEEVTKAHEVLAEDQQAPEAEPQPEVVVPEESPPSDDEQLLERRDGITEAIEERAARKLKRVLADEQNEVLDHARRTHVSDVDALLGSMAEQEAKYAAAAGFYLAEAAAAGAAFYGDDKAKGGSVDDLASQLAHAIVSPLRERLATNARDAGSDEEALADGIRSCYREWKTQRLGAEARHVVLAAFNRGLFTAAPKAICHRWLVDDGGSPCPDAEDNALAGPVRKGEEYPTGHQYPPAHPGCRCLLVPVPAADSSSA